MTREEATQFIIDSFGGMLLETKLPNTNTIHAIVYDIDTSNGDKKIVTVNGAINRIIDKLVELSNND